MARGAGARLGLFGLFVRGHERTRFRRVRARLWMRARAAAWGWPRGPVGLRGGSVNAVVGAVLGRRGVAKSAV